MFGYSKQEKWRLLNLTFLDFSLGFFNLFTIFVCDVNFVRPCTMDEGVARFYIGTTIFILLETLTVLTVFFMFLHVRGGEKDE